MDYLPPSLSLAGVRIDALTLQDLLRVLDHGITARAQLIILNHNLHSLYLYTTDPCFRAAYSLASAVYVDGMAVVWLGSLAGLAITPANRITFLDSFEVIVAEANRRKWRIFYLGSTASVNEKGLTLLRRTFPGLDIAGQDGFFDKRSSKNEDVIARINDRHTDILFIGMGMPDQERWLVENHASLRVGAILTSGATLDYVVGDAYKPPPWAGPLGLYGLMRLTSDPRRLWRRYLLEPLLLARRLGLPLLRQRLQKQ